MCGEVTASAPWFVPHEAAEEPCRAPRSCRLSPCSFLWLPLLQTLLAAKNRTSASPCGQTDLFLPI